MLFYIFSWFENSTIWLVESILANISGTRFFLKYGICARVQQIIETFVIDQIQKNLMFSGGRKRVQWERMG